MSNLLKQYNELSNDEKKEMIAELYTGQNWSFDAIAEKCGTYANKVRRDAIKLGIQVKTRSEAQAIAIAQGRSIHPTKGKSHTIEVKSLIGKKVSNIWKGLDETERKKRQEIGKETWKNLSDMQKQNIRRKANAGIREASKTGSKLEKFLYEGLIKAGFQVQFHIEQSLANQLLHIDMFIPGLGIAIEVDGPSHFKPIWGHKTFARNLKADSQKTGLIIAQGLIMIRVKQTKRLSQIYMLSLLEKLIDRVNFVKTGNLEDKDSYIEVI
jgi:very-short-patch-repair endonuclease